MSTRLSTPHKMATNIASPVLSTKEHVPSFLRSNSERRAAEHSVRITHDQTLISRNLDEHSFLVARAAAISGDLAYLKKLIAKNPALATSTDHFGRTLLIYAALSGQTDCVQWLASKDGGGGGGSDIRAKDRDGMTAVHWAVHKGHHRTLKALLKRQANGDPLMGDQEGATALHMAVKQPSTKCLDVIIDWLAKRDRLSAVVAVVDKGGRSPVHWAAAAGRLAELLKHTKDRVRITFEEADDEGRTPLMWSVLSDSSTTTSLELITQRAPRSIRAQDKTGYTALHLAVMVDNIPAIEHFLECKLCNPNIVDHEGRTSLHWAGILGRPGASTLLIRAKVDLNRRDRYGATAMHYAAQSNYVETLKTMLRHCADDPLDNDGRTCFMRAAAYGAIDTLVAIVNTTKSADPEQKDAQGATALHLAARSGQDAAVRFLLDRGWSTDAQDNQGHTPLLSAAEYGQASTLQLLLKSGAAVWHKDTNGRTALHWSALGGHAFICQILVKQGVSVDAVDVGGRTAVHCASFGGFIGCLSVLLQAGAHPCIPDNEGLIALHLAAAEGNLDVCKRLLDSGSLVNAIYDDEQGRRFTPYDLALANGHTQVADFLIENGGMSFDQLINVAATKVQACYRGYRVRKARKVTKPLASMTSSRTGTSQGGLFSRLVRKKK